MTKQSNICKLQNLYANIFLKLLLDHISKRCPQQKTDTHSEKDTNEMVLSRLLCKTELPTSKQFHRYQTVLFNNKCTTFQVD
jgi:hypothetical protein